MFSFKATDISLALRTSPYSEWHRWSGAALLVLPPLNSALVENAVIVEDDNHKKATS